MRKVLDKEEAIWTMNILGSKETPFLFVIDYEMEKNLVFPLSSLPDFLLFDINGFTNAREVRQIDFPIEMTRFPLDSCEYELAFNEVMKEIYYGNSFLLNLAFPTPVDCNLSLEEIFYASQARYKLLLEDEFTCFSPETFIQIKKGKVSSFPMKGTIDATLPNAAQQLLSDEKEAAEHATIVDLIRNDLSRIAKHVRVDRYRYLDRLDTNVKSLYQMSSQITGDLPYNYAEKIGDLLFELLPAGSISGAPKPKTLEIIAKAEGEKRGYYTGVMGYFDGKDLDSGVMIRFMERKEGSYWYRSGCGITHQSKMELEYQEMIDKVYVPIV
jgi:para-aminobenzoate synthetase component 1